jgi:type IV secretion system protein VirB1
VDLSALIPIVLACAPNVAPSTIMNIIQTESSGRPYAININYGQGRLQRQPNSEAEAVAWGKWLYDNGYNFDAGLMQINSKNFKSLGVTAAQIFRPCTNIQSGAKILTDNYVAAAKTLGPGQNALHAALSAYNTGSQTRGFKNGYVNNVRKAAGLPPIGSPARTSAVRASPPLQALPHQDMAAWNVSNVRPWGQPTIAASRSNESTNQGSAR